MSPSFGFSFKKDGNLDDYLTYRLNRRVYNKDSRQKIAQLSDSFKKIVFLARDLSESGFEIMEGLRTPNDHQHEITIRAEQSTNNAPVRGFSVRVAPFADGQWLPVGNPTQEALFLKAALDAGVAPATHMSDIYPLLNKTYKDDIKESFRKAHKYLSVSGSTVVFSDETNEVLSSGNYIQVNYFSMTEI